MLLIRTCAPVPETGAAAGEFIYVNAETGALILLRVVSDHRALEALTRCPSAWEVVYAPFPRPAVEALLKALCQPEGAPESRPVLRLA